MTVREYSGESCADRGQKAGDTLDIELTFETRADGETEGYLDGPKLDFGRFKGRLGAPLALEQASVDESNAKGHQLVLSLDGRRLTIELRERPATPGTRQCNVRSAIIEVAVVETGASAREKYRTMSVDFLKSLEGAAAFRRDPEAFREAAALTRLAEQATRDKKPGEAAALYARRHPLLLKVYGPAHERIFNSLETWADQLEDAGQLSEAVQIQGKALTLAKEILVTEPLKIASASSNLVRMLQAAGRYEEALAHASFALELSEKSLDAHHPDVGRRLAALGRVHQRLGAPQTALPLFQRALQVSEKNDGPTHVRVGIRMADLAGVLQALGRYSEALPVMQRALVIAEKGYGATHRETGITVGNLASLLEAMGRYDETLPLYRRALEIALQANGPGHTSTGIAMGNLANALSLLGRYAEALPVQQQAVEIGRKNFGAVHPELAMQINNLAGLHRSLGQFSQALELYEKALGMVETSLGARHPTLAVHLNNLAQLQAALGQFEPAIANSRRALMISEQALGAGHPTVATRLSNLGLMLETTEQFTEAIEMLRRAAAVTESSLGPLHPDGAIRKNNLAHALVSMGQLEPALPVYQQALALSEKTRGVGHPESANVRNNLATLLVRLKRSPEAVPLAMQSFVVAQQGESPLTRFHAARTVAFVRYGAGEKDAAIVYGKYAVNIMQQVRHGAASLNAAQRRGLLGENQSIYHSLANWLIAAGRLAEAEQVMGMLKDQELYNLIALNAGNARRAVPYLPAEMSLLSSLGIPSAGAVSAVGGDSSVDGMKAVLARADASAKPGATASLSYVVTEDRLSIILTSAQGAIAAQQPLDQRALARQIAAFRLALGNPRIDPRPQAQALYKILIAPVEEELRASGASTLSLSLTDVLRYIPFGALHDGRDYLVQRYALALFTPAGGVSVVKPDVQQWKVAGMGLTQAVSGFSALPAVRTELESIVRTAVNPAGAVSGTLALDRQFDRSQLESALAGGFPAIHLASHFQFTQGSENGSFLLLGNGDKLSLAEIKRMNFKGVQMLALSACNTASGGGYGESGAEVEGLGAAVQLAGAQSVLASLWEVSDSSTAVLMRNFYRLRTPERQSTGAQITAAQAMRQAQLALLEGRTLAGEPAQRAGDDDLRGASARAKDDPLLPRFTPDSAKPWAHPFYWAPFVLMGNWL